MCIDMALVSPNVDDCYLDCYALYLLVSMEHVAFAPVFTAFLQETLALRRFAGLLSFAC